MKLNNCPCCGSKAMVMTRKEDFNESAAKNGRACVSIDCTNRQECGMTLFCHYDSKDFDTMVEKATEQWNRRAYGV